VSAYENNTSDVVFTVADGRSFTFKKSEGKEVKHLNYDALIFYFKRPSNLPVGTVWLTPPGATLGLPSMATKEDREVMIVSYAKSEDVLTGKFVISSGVISKIDLTPGKEMVYYDLDTSFGQSGAAIINRFGQVVAFHNKIGGGVPVTSEMLVSLSKN